MQRRFLNEPNQKPACSIDLIAILRELSPMVWPVAASHGPIIEALIEVGERDRTLDRKIPGVLMQDQNLRRHPAAVLACSGGHAFAVAKAV